MRTLDEFCVNRETLSLGLKELGGKHQNYKWYTSMENALNFLSTGDLYLSNGQNWNDKTDRDQMMEKGTYARCFSSSTRESIAMWMLYGGDRGKRGVMINFTPSVVQSITDATTVELGYFETVKTFLH